MEHCYIGITSQKIIYKNMENKLIINISTDFTDAPGARNKKDGPKSGEEFYEDLLRPKFIEVSKKWR